MSSMKHVVGCTTAAQHGIVRCARDTSETVRKRVVQSGPCESGMHETIAISGCMQGEINTLWGSVWFI